MTFFQHHSFAGNSEEMTLTADLQQTNDVTNMIYGQTFGVSTTWNKINVAALYSLSVIEM
jgi:hypothetical protein